MDKQFTAISVWSLLCLQLFLVFQRYYLVLEIRMLVTLSMLDGAFSPLTHQIHTHKPGF